MTEHSFIPFLDFDLELCDRRFYYGVLFTIAIILFTIVSVVVNGPGDYLVFPFILSIVCATMSWENRGHRRCILDSSNRQYSFYENGHLTYCGAFNNIYIRLKEQKYGVGSVYYYVVFNGYHVHEQKITSYTTNRKRLRSLARKLAASLDLNYFDSRIYSKDHIVRHPRPQAIVSASASSKDVASTPV